MLGTKDEKVSVLRECKFKPFCADYSAHPTSAGPGAGGQMEIHVLLSEYLNV